MHEDQALAGIFRRLLSDPHATVELRGSRLIINGEVELASFEIEKLPKPIGNPNLAQEVERLRATITSLQRTAQHLRGDGHSSRWEGDAAKLETTAAQHQAELDRLLGDQA